jgi:hypothetical protein
MEEQCLLLLKALKHISGLEPLNIKVRVLHGLLIYIKQEIMRRRAGIRSNEFEKDLKKIVDSDNEVRKGLGMDFGF